MRNYSTSYPATNPCPKEKRPGGAAKDRPMQTTTNESETKPPRSMPATAKAPEIASASVPDTLAALHVNPETGLTHGEVETSPEGARLQRGGRAERTPGPQVPRKILGPVGVDARADHDSVARAAELRRSRHCRRTAGRQCGAGLLARAARRGRDGDVAATAPGQCARAARCELAGRSRPRTGPRRHRPRAPR